MRYEEYNDMLIDKKEQELQVTADHLGCTVEELGMGKTLEEKFAQFKKLKKGWIMTKPNGEEWTTIKEIKFRPQKDKKTGEKRNYARLSVQVPIEWIGYSAKVVLSKKVTPKMVYNFEGEITIEDIVNGADPSKLVTLVEEEKNAKPKETFKERKKREHPDWTEEDYQEYLDATSE